MKRLVCWCLLLWKRLLRRPAYLAVLLAVPLLTLALSALSGGAGGLVTVALTHTEAPDAAAARVEDRLLSASGVVHVELYEEPGDALESLLRGETDAVWILDPLTEGLSHYASRGWSDGVIRVIEREDNILLMLARETLFGAVFPELSFVQFSQLLSDEFGETDPGVLETYYRSGVVSSEIIRFETLSGVARTENHVVSPVRGLLSLLVLLAALSSALYSIGEQRRETFVWLPGPLRRALPLLSHLLAALPVGCASLLALAAAHLGRGVGAEIAAMLLYCAAAAVFAELLRIILRSEERYAAAIPVVVLLSLALTPVFVELDVLRPVRCLLPGYWYLHWTQLL